MDRTGERPGVPEAPPPRERANRHAFWLAAAVGVVVWFGADIAESYLAPRTEMFMAGEALGVALLSSVLGGVVAFVSRTRWPRWRYPLVVGALGVCLTVPGLVPTGAAVAGHATAAADPAAPAAGTTTEDPAATTSTAVRRTATAPAAVGAWTRDDSPAARTRAAAALDQYRSHLGEGDTADLQLYRRGTEQAVLLVVTTRPGSDLDDETNDPEQTVADELAGAGVKERSAADPGALGGALECGSSAKDSRLYICAWGELGLTGTMLFVGTHETPDSAAQVTRDFREGSEH